MAPGRRWRLNLGSRCPGRDPRCWMEVQGDAQDGGRPNEWKSMGGSCWRLSDGAPWLRVAAARCVWSPGGQRSSGLGGKMATAAPGCPGSLRKVRVVTPNFPGAQRLPAERTQPSGGAPSPATHESKTPLWGLVLCTLWSSGAGVERRQPSECTPALSQTLERNNAVGPGSLYTLELRGWSGAQTAE